MDISRLLHIYGLFLLKSNSIYSSRSLSSSQRRIKNYLLLHALIGQTFFTKVLKIKPLVWMGKISYGLYIWHLVSIQITFQMLPGYLLLDIILSFILTLSLGSLSYYFFESPFLIFKE